jgi:molybdopterin-guanine dinucleotide biosynthesis protein A
MKYTIPAIIFAGGKSSRMGEDKSLMPFRNYPTLSEFQYHKLQQYFDDVYLSAKTDKFTFPSKVLTDKYKESSPLVGLISVLEQLDCEAIFILSVDAPLVDENVIKKLWEAYIEEKNKKDSKIHAILAKSPSGLQPLCGIYKKSILNSANINMKKNKHSLKSLLNVCSTRSVLFTQDTAFTNVNTQDDYLILLNSDIC